MAIKFSNCDRNWGTTAYKSSLTKNAASLWEEPAKSTLASIDADQAREVTEIRKNLEWLSDALLAASENGLFRFKEVAITFEAVHHALDKARKDFDNGKGDLNETKKSNEECWKLLDEALNQAGNPYRNRFIHVRGIAFLLATTFVAILIGLAWAGTSTWFDTIPYWALLIGGLGGCLRGLWWLFKHVSRKDFRRSWWLWYVISPIVGSGLGVLTYFAVLAAVAATTTSTTISQAGLTMFLAGFAGFNWNWAVQFLENLAGAKSTAVAGVRP
ncbi:MAG: hypothetical protein HY296_08445 [Thaumarchaeota archaeon]|nr:hypothetical protein [Nitrososphaerota archaeon]